MAPFDVTQDLEFRRLAFSWLDNKSARGSRSLSRIEINEFKDHVPQARHRLFNQEGIWKPADLVGTLSVTSGLASSRHNPYVDRITSEGLVEYAFTDAPTKQSHNQGLRLAEKYDLPIIYFRAVQRSLYDAYFPVRVRGIDENRRVALLDLTSGMTSSSRADIDFGAEIAGVKVEYREQLVRRRLHQRDFRSNVMVAYTTKCSVCSLGYAQLLDAAHILEDARGGLAEISNGLSLCKIHHAAYDSNILGVDQDHRIHIREDIRQHVDGPMLRHGLQEEHGRKLRIVPKGPKLMPNQEHLAARFEKFLSAG